MQVRNMVMLSITDQKMIAFGFDGFAFPVHEYVVGQLYNHPAFGQGKVTALEKKDNARYIVVEFVERGTKRLDPSIAPLSRIGLMAQAETDILKFLPPESPESSGA